jgi:membrane protein YqaA with SNARE-associated domain
VFIGMLLGGVGTPWLLVLVASLGNVLGAVLNWWLGLELERFSGRRWFPVSPSQLERARGWYQRWGRWTLLLSWMPVIGDPLTVIAGVMRESLWVFLALVGFSKTCRFAALAYITLYWA